MMFQERKRNAIVLLLRYLRDNGYVDSAEVLQKESSLAPGSVDAADNISLERIFRELEEHHIQRFGQPPKLFRRAGETLDVETGTAGLGVGRPGQRGVPLGRDAAEAPKTSTTKRMGLGAAASSLRRRRPRPDEHQS